MLRGRLCLCLSELVGEYFFDALIGNECNFVLGGAVSSKIFYFAEVFAYLFKNIVLVSGDLCAYVKSRFEGSVINYVIFLGSAPAEQLFAFFMLCAVYYVATTALAVGNLPAPLP